LKSIILERKLILDETGLKIVLEKDFIKYYKWLVESHTYKTIQLICPKHGAHITIVSSKLHKEFDRIKLSQYNNQLVSFIYNPEDIRVGGNDFTNYWLPVLFPLGDQIKIDLGIVESDFLGFHITIANNKNKARYNQ